MISHVTWSCPTPKSWRISGNATAIIVEFSGATTLASETVASNNKGLVPEVVGFVLALDLNGTLCAIHCNHGAVWDDVRRNLRGNHAGNCVLAGADSGV